MKRALPTSLILTLAISFGYAQQDSTKQHIMPVVDGSNGRCLPSPLASPPFPGSEWDGAPIIGAPAEAPDYPLQKALGLAKQKSRIKIYGWVGIGGNFSTSRNSNAPTSYNIVPNSIVLDQIILRVERQPNTVQTDHVDWGFLVDNIYGTDYRYTIAKGIVSDQLLKSNHLYGYDPTQVYGLLYIPKVAQGLLIKVGRFISPSDIEAQWAPDNYMYSHSLMFTVDPYTFTGAQATLRINQYWQVELGVHAGNDVAPWSNSANVNGLAMVRWVSKNNNNSIYAGINSLGNGKYTNEHDNLQMVVSTWGHRFSSKVHMMTELYYIWQKDAAMGGTPIYGPGKPYYMGTGIGTIVPGISAAVGAVNYFQIQLSAEKDYISVRNDFLNDPQGNRTGFATAYSSHTIGWVHHFNNLIRIRPEVRYERAYDKGATPYDNGTKKDQVTGAMDLIVRF
ncbi:putative OmpL-like beta-barrel porin-2 [Chitinophaga niastensis]|uniref:Putative OmpL-like beta-barrel porin-2 n=1 Tax=Chitinophaga niastensis TaxID=536980 RepID=A0A2P8HJI8_CHINA|nr:outer membrane beta-barrel protein [Chitinophaga niastensis]PSL46383.1 putative OmpL-like beta-barrel porin-2 [Chitinophaga niastensis]